MDSRFMLVCRSHEGCLPQGQPTDAPKLKYDGKTKGFLLNSDECTWRHRTTDGRCTEESRGWMGKVEEYLCNMHQARLRARQDMEAPNIRQLKGPVNRKRKSAAMVEEEEDDDDQE
ncbi:uncharacterized protein J4E88_002783 [Alternaria novae-zelandiae]|uniref:uncharacterized protein n=1 Tax=Alternaria novae-zelandiae TaxID=430562 RepID=UPI0020C33443|nr:uncharacterized protein J4E88_002783 [Alternaria novae-zelandiae]KAI4689431.1 hypothetical protein J4E88_002783 [Alternaria novae-zelandiae]